MNKTPQRTDPRKSAYGSETKSPLLEKQFEAPNKTTYPVPPEDHAQAISYNLIK